MHAEHGLDSSYKELYTMLVQWMLLYWATLVPGHFDPIKRLARISELPV